MRIVHLHIIYYPSAYTYIHYIIHVVIWMLYFCKIQFTMYTTTTYILYISAAYTNESICAYNYDGLYYLFLLLSLTTDKMWPANPQLFLFWTQYLFFFFSLISIVILNKVYIYIGYYAVIILFSYYTKPYLIEVFIQFYHIIRFCL